MDTGAKNQSPTGAEHRGLKLQTVALVEAELAEMLCTHI